VCRLDTWVLKVVQRCELVRVSVDFSKGRHPIYAKNGHLGEMPKRYLGVSTSFEFLSYKSQGTDFMWAVLLRDDTVMTSISSTD